MTEHPVQQEISYILIANLLEYNPHQPEQGTVSRSDFFQVGYEGVTRIEACTKSGMYANIPYVRVWKGDVAVAEFCQHQIVGVYFKAPT
jgi:hypothetical protein